MQQFKITLKNDKIKYYKFIALLLVAFNLAVFIYLLTAGIHLYEIGLALLFSVLYLVFHLYKSKKAGVPFFIKGVSFFILAGGWIILQNYLLAIACIVLGILYRLSLQKLEFLFREDFIRRLNFPRKEYPWSMIGNVMMRDNILTIDFKNNTLIQLEAENNINEIQFNEFVRHELFKNSGSAATR
ncbi:MAG: hypothetical protein ABI416_18860 [Ginsengibacter sp.]